MTVSTGAGGGGAVVVSAGGFCGVQAPARNAIITRLGIQRFKILAILYKSRDLPPGDAGFVGQAVRPAKTGWMEAALRFG